MNEMRHVKAFLSQGGRNAELACKLAFSMATQVRSLPQPVDCGIASELKEAVLMSGYDDAGKEMIVAAIEEQLFKGLVVPGKGSSKQGISQKLHEHLPRFILKHEAVQFQSPSTSYEAKQQLLIDRLGKLGVINPDEYTVAYCVALLLIWHVDKLPSHRSSHRKLLDFKAALALSKKAYPLHPIHRFPSTPHELPEDNKLWAYGEQAEFNDDTVPSLRYVAMEHIALRGNSKLLKKKRKKERKRKKHKRRRRKSSHSSSSSRDSSSSQSSRKRKPATRDSGADNEVVNAAATRQLLLRQLTGDHSDSQDASAGVGMMAIKDGTEGHTDPQLVPHPVPSVFAPSPIVYTAEKEAAGKGDVAVKENGYAAVPRLTADEKTMLDAVLSRKEKAKAKRLAKRPAGAVKMKKPAAAVSPGGMVKHTPPMPTAHSSLGYRAGRVYTIWGQRKFRAIKDVKTPSKEKILKWAGKTPTKKEWQSALTAVDDYWDK